MVLNGYIPKERYGKINKINIQVEMSEKEQSICKESKKRKIVKLRTEIKDLKAKIK